MFARIDTTALTALVQAARQGDDAAWWQLYEEFTPMLRRIAARHGLTGDDIADVVQATWSKCFEHLARLRDPAALPGWLSTVCSNEAIAARRAQAKCTPVDSQDDEARLARLPAAEGTTAGDPLENLLESETFVLVHSLLDELGERDRNLMHALIEEEASYRRIAELLDMPIGSIGPTRQRIVARLRRRADVLEIAAA